MTTAMIRSALGALSLVALLVGPVGCAEVDEEGGPVGEAAQAVRFSHLSASPSPINFGTIASGADKTLTITLTNIGELDASNIELDVPPDPYRVFHNPPGYLVADGSSIETQITFAPTSTGVFANNIVFWYRDANPLSPGTLRSLTVPVTGTAN
ncbi:Hypothetical protein A7982_03409 [Minicystis rosea]|nr:Hypothetical protein A7982_03409 [Minicystis rosea]